MRRRFSYTHKKTYFLFLRYRNTEVLSNYTKV